MRRHANEQEEARLVNEARSELRRRLNRSEEALRPAMPEPAAEEVSARALKPGDRVRLKAMDLEADVLSVSPEGMVSLCFS